MASFAAVAVTAATTSGPSSGCFAFWTSSSAKLLGGLCCGCLTGLFAPRQTKRVMDRFAFHGSKRVRGFLNKHIDGQGTLKVKIKAAHNLNNVDSGMIGDGSDPFVQVTVGNLEFRTNAIKDSNSNPVWDNPAFEYPVDFQHANQSKFLIIEVFESNSISNSVGLGKVEMYIPSMGLKLGEEIERRVKLTQGKGAELSFSVQFVPSIPVCSFVSTVPWRHQSFRHVTVEASTSFECPLSARGRSFSAASGMPAASGADASVADVVNKVKKVATPLDLPDTAVGA